MRFDDSLKTVLAADTSSAFGARAAFLQLTDLIARRRADPAPELLRRVAELRARVPLDVRVAAARSLALAEPPEELVALAASDDVAVAAAALRAARLSPDGWERLIPGLGPVGRSVLRSRRDLPPSAGRALASFGTADFALVDGRSERTDEAPPPAVESDALAELVGRLDEAASGGNPVAPVRAFAFESDAAGVIRWVDTAPRGVIVGLSLRHEDAVAPSVDGVVAGAFAKRGSFRNGRLLIVGDGPLGGEWRVNGNPMFDRDTGRFEGFRGSARRPHVEEMAGTARTNRAPGTGAQIDGLRRLMHELRTPTNAIAGFSELIEGEMLGPVAPPYRARAGTIRRHVDDLTAAIDDLDTAARIEADALDLRPGEVTLADLFDDLAAELRSLGERRGSRVSFAPSDAALSVVADRRAVERLLTRLSATLLSGTDAGETLTVQASPAGAQVAVSITLPRAFAALGTAALLRLDDESLDGDAPLLGVGFSLRLAQRLAAELGGRMTIAADRLTVTLPSGLNGDMDQASNRGS